MCAGWWWVGVMGGMLWEGRKSDMNIEYCPRSQPLPGEWWGGGLIIWILWHWAGLSWAGVMWGKSPRCTGCRAIKTSKIQQWQSNCWILLNSGELAATVSKCQFGPSPVPVGQQTSVYYREGDVRFLYRFLLKLQTKIINQLLSLLQFKYLNNNQHFRKLSLLLSLCLHFPTPLGSCWHIPGLVAQKYL